MANIRCGNCKGYHNSVTEVRDCYNRIVPVQDKGPSNGATDKQLSLIHQLVTEREVPECFEVRKDLTKREASQLIDLLFSKPKKVVVGARDAMPNTVPTHDVPNGTYTVGDEEDYVTIKIEEGAKWADGQTVVSFLSGSDNEVSYTGFAFLTDQGLKVWKRFREESRPIAAVQYLLTGNVDEAHERFLNLAEAFALESGHCMRCGRKLTVPASLHRGLGPVCAGIEGV